MVQGEQQRVLPVGQPHQRRPQQRTASQIERAERFLRHPPRQLPPALLFPQRRQVDRLERERPRGRRVNRVHRVHHLQRSVGPRSERRAQRLVAPRQLAEHRRELLFGQLAFERQGERHVVHRAPRLEQIEEPQTPLRERRRERAAALRVPRQGNDRRGRPRAPPSPCSARSTARPATVGCSKSARTGSSTPSRSRSRETTWVASSECPPRAKKLSCTPTRSRPSRSPQIPASTSSVRRTRCLVAPPPVAVSPGAGSALRSTFPVRVSGSAASSTHTDGTMNEGRREPR